MGTEDKFYHFEESSGAIGETGNSGRNATKERVVFVVIILALVAALIGVSVYYGTKDNTYDSGSSVSGTDEQKGATQTTTVSSTTAASTTQVTTPAPDLDALRQRIDCIPEAQGGIVMVTEKLCITRNCLYEETNAPNIPVCYFNPNTGYKVKSIKDTALGFQVELQQTVKGPFTNDFQEAVFDVEMYGNDIVRFKFDDPLFKRYKVPLTLDLPKETPDDPKYEVKVTDNDTFAFQIIRQSTGKILWDTGVGGLVLSHQFFQISTKLPSVNIYGFGENLHKRFKHDLNHTTWPMFSRDQAPSWQAYGNLYGVHPFYTCMEGDGNSHGIFLLNSNAQDYSFTPSPMLTYRTIGGILDFYMFLGPHPTTVVQQYTGIIGRPYMPPYWSLGFQLCRYGYKSLDKLKEAVERTKKYNIPHDVQYADIDHMDEQKDFTIDNTNFAGLKDYFTSLREGGMKTIIILDPTLIAVERGYEAYDNLTAISGSIKWPGIYNAPDLDKDTTNAIYGYVWPKGKVVFPDFFKDETKELWKRLIVKHRDKIPFDALWIDMNEPANFGTNEDKPWNWPDDVTPVWSLQCPQNSRYENPPYRTKAAYVFDNDKRQARISDKTICMVTTQGNNNEYRHYNVHSLYGWSQTKPTLDAVRAATGTRSLVLTRSTFPGSGKYGGHWLGDNDSQWKDLHESIIGMLEFNLFGIPYIGADICGFWGNASADLCKRWMQLGAFYPFSRNHNGIDNMEQDPGYYGDDVANAARVAIETRYWLLPYLYTLFHKAHIGEDMVVKPLFHEFPKDSFSYDVDRQFLWGSSLMIVPILQSEEALKRVQNVKYYYRPTSAVWYDFYTGKLQPNSSLGVRTIHWDSKIGLYVRGGSILPMQRPANNTHYSRKNAMKLLVALDDNGSATGDLFWDNTDDIDTFENGKYLYAQFSSVIKDDQNFVSIKIINNTMSDMNLRLDTIEIYGAKPGIMGASLNGKTVNLVNDQDISFHLTVNEFNVPLSDMTLTLWRSTAAPRIDCFPESKGGVELVTEELCTSRKCAYYAGAVQGPVCYFDPNNYGYNIAGDRVETQYGFEYPLTWKGWENPYAAGPGGSKDVQQLVFSVEMRSNDVLRIKIYDNATARYEVPLKMNLGSDRAMSPKYEVKVYTSTAFNFKVIRKSSQEVIWDSGAGGLIFSDQYLQISTILPTKNMYGFGENVHNSFRHDFGFRTWPMWSRDQPTSWGSNLNHYGVHPFYTCMEESGMAHGVLLLNSNAQDYTLTPGPPKLTYKTIGGILDFYYFLGPEPENVIQQYTKAIGLPYMPPYWSLGFQLCRYGYNSLDNLKAAVNRTQAAGIPLDVQYADIDHMNERMDFTIDNTNFAGLKDYFDQLRASGMHTIIILDPTLISNVTDYKPFEMMRDSNSNIKWAADDRSIPPDSSLANRDLLGYVWPTGKVVFPDFFKNSTKFVWKQLIVDHHKTLTFDGLWIDMNEPANFGTNLDHPWNWPADVKPYWSLNCTLEGSTIEQPPYRTMAAYAHDEIDAGRKAMLSDKTICLRAVQGDSDEYIHYDVHSLYGWAQTPPTLEGLRAATGQRGIVISRSTFPGSGKYGGHWLGDNNSVWDNLRKSIIGILEFNLFGIPYIGADICGFMGNTTAELCTRWMQLGAFYTYSRNHNGIDSSDQDPAVLGASVAKASRVAMETRYSLLPYLYTLFYKAHVRGNTVIRPVHHEFPNDHSTYGIDEQFMWGQALLISPILYEGQTSVTMYLPRGPWYDFYTGGEMPVQSGYHSQSVQADSTIPLHVRAGYILPMQKSAQNTHLSRQNPFMLKVGLEDSENGVRGFRARGDLYWDDGVTIDTYENGLYYYSKFDCEHDTLSMTIEHNNSDVSGLYIDTIYLYGVTTNVNYVYTGDKLSHTDFMYDKQSKVLIITKLNLPLANNFQLEWREYRWPTQTEMGRVDCLPDLVEGTTSDNTNTQCHARGCMYHAIQDLPNLPQCYLIDSLHGYHKAQSGFLQKNTNSSMFGGDITLLDVLVQEYGDDTLRIKIYDPTASRYEVPVPLNLPLETVPGTSNKYEVIQTTTIGDTYTIQVKRKSDGKIIWDTSAGPLIFSDQYIQLSTHLPSDNLYGLGEHRHAHLKHNMDYKTWPIFTRDAAVNSPDYTNLYGAHPFYMNVEGESGNTHAVLLLNSNAMEIVMNPRPSLTYRIIGGVLDFYFFLGPEPESVIQQYTQVIGHPFMLPYWSLGFQLCRWGYDNLDNMKSAVDRTRDAGIPHDIQYADIDHMIDQKDFTIDPINFGGLPEYVKELQAGGMHFIIIVDPAIISSEPAGSYPPYDSGVTDDIFIKWPENMGPEDSKIQPQNYMLGYVWPTGKTVFPDFLKNATTDYWVELIDNHHKTLAFDGLWIDMNEPANFDTNGVQPWNWPANQKPWSLKCSLDNNTLDHPPYKPKSVLGDLLSEKTLCMVGQQADGQYNHYDVHSLYGLSETKPTMLGVQKATGKRGIVISRSTYPSSGRYGGHWLGDNDSFWRNLHDSVIGIIEFNLFGIPYIGADICGFFAGSTAEMCQRWMQLGAFYTFSRNHNGKGMKEQDPAIFGAAVADSSRRAMEIRYSLLPYLYTQFYRVHKYGGTVIRSMMHEFTSDPRTWTIDTQFMWGSAFMIAPVLEQGHIDKDVYFPEGKWFNYYTGKEYSDMKRTVTVDAPRDHIPLYIRGGHILPTQRPANNTVFSRKNPLGLLVGLNDDMSATGNLFWDDGDSINTIENGEYFFAEFELSHNTSYMSVTMTIVHNNTPVTGLVVDDIWLYGYTSNLISFDTFLYDYEYFTDSSMLHLKNLALPLSNNFTIGWTYT